MYVKLCRISCAWVCVHRVKEMQKRRKKKKNSKKKKREKMWWGVKKSFNSTIPHSWVFSGMDNDATKRNTKRFFIFTPLVCPSPGPHPCPPHSHPISILVFARALIVKSFYQPTAAATTFFHFSSPVFFIPFFFILTPCKHSWEGPTTNASKNLYLRTFV